jgi:hypothetical protein
VEHAECSLDTEALESLGLVRDPKWLSWFEFAEHFEKNLLALHTERLAWALFFGVDCAFGTYLL